MKTKIFLIVIAFLALNSFAKAQSATVGCYTYKQIPTTIDTVWSSAQVVTDTISTTEQVVVGYEISEQVVAYSPQYTEQSIKPETDGYRVCELKIPKVKKTVRTYRPIFRTVRVYRPVIKTVSTYTLNITGGIVKQVPCRE